MNEVQSCVTQIGQEGTHYTERERDRWNQDRTDASAPSPVLQKSSSDRSEKKKNVSAHNESLANGHIHLWLWIQRLYFHFVHHTLTREPLVYDKYSPSPFKFSCGTLREFVKSQVHTNRCVQMIRALLREMQLCSLKKWINAGSEVELLTLQFQSKDLCISDLEMNPKYLFNV